MSEINNHPGLTLFLGIVSIGVLIGMVRMGPVDYTRTIYNAVIGDTPSLQFKLVDYCRKGIKKKNWNMEDSEIEKKLAKELGLTYRGERINPQGASIEDLWDLSEEYAYNGQDRWLWTSLDAIEYNHKF